MRPWDSSRLANLIGLLNRPRCLLVHLGVGRGQLLFGQTACHLELFSHLCHRVASHFLRTFLSQNNISVIVGTVKEDIMQVIKID
jgi:hypothetical protein